MTNTNTEEFKEWEASLLTKFQNISNNGIEEYKKNLYSKSFPFVITDRTLYNPLGEHLNECRYKFLNKLSALRTEVYHNIEANKNNRIHYFNVIVEHYYAVGLKITLIEIENSKKMSEIEQEYLSYEGEKFIFE